MEKELAAVIADLRFIVQNMIMAPAARDAVARNIVRLESIQSNLTKKQ